MSNEKDTKAPVEEPQDIETFDNIPDEEGAEIEEVKEELNAEMNEADDLRAKLDEAKAEVDKQKTDYLYLRAEFDNFRKRSLKEKSDLIKTAAESTLKDLLPIIDDFERAIEANASNDDPASIKEGTELIYNKLIKYLASKGVKAIDSTGKEFDADLHEAIAMVPGDEEKKGKVIDTLTKGYTLGDKVIRHAKVAVGQ